MKNHILLILSEMSPKFVNIHTHQLCRSTTYRDVEAIYAYMIGSDEAVQCTPSAIFFMPDKTDVLNSFSALDVRYSAGVHPWDADKGYAWRDDIFTSRLVAVGEIGLDYARNVDKTVQKRCLIQQLDIAREHNLPIIIHCVKAYDDLMMILADVKFAELLPKTVIHGFTGSAELAERLLNCGFYLSFGARTFDSPKTVAALKNTPLERLFLETDAVEMTIKQMYEQVSTIIQTDICVLQQAIHINFIKLFG